MGVSDHCNNRWRDVIYKGDNNYYLEGSSNNSRRPALGGTFGNPIYGTAALAANTWTHLAGTYDGATMRLYVNGVQVASRAQTGAIATSTNPLQIGGDSIYGQYFAGQIDEIRVYNRALSAAEVQSDMNTPLTAASDNFNRADGGLGLNWAKPVPASEQTLVIVNNEVTPDIEEAHCYAYWVGNTFSQDQYSQVRISNVGTWNGVIARAQPMHRPILYGLCIWAQRLPPLSAKGRPILFPAHRQHGDVGALVTSSGWRRRA